MQAEWAQRAADEIRFRWRYRIEPLLRRIGVKGFLAIGLGVFVIAAATLTIHHRLTRPPPPVPDLPGGRLVACNDLACTHTFALSARQSASLGPDERPVCPRCGKNDTSEAVRCTECQALHPRDVILRVQRTGQSARCGRCESELPFIDDTNP